uniref:Fatty acid desaturase n=1 Tax=Cyanothece sp. (strain PCC 7425 / ATCC 29141) TaxID=395961 RepID=B8HXM7_CYAP4
MTLLFDPNLEEVSRRDAQLRLRHILKTIPREYFRKDPVQAWTGVVISLVMAAVGYAAIAYAPWYLLPFAWIFTGTAMTGWFVIGHDCGHRSFAKRRWVNDLVGHFFMLPLVYPFHSWRILHDYHHKHTNKLEVDNAWQPFQPEFYAKATKPVQLGYRALRSWFWWVASIVHCVGLHFNWTKFEGQQRSQVKFSALLVIGFALIFFPVLVVTTGWWGLVKFWLMPWLVYHFWMSTFTLVHHTALDIPFKPEGSWQEALAQLSGTVHCEYPHWVEFLCHHINVHVPHHISTAIPSYNLRRAHQSLREHWGDYLVERQFSWALMQEIVGQCHLYERDRGYLSFQEYEAKTAR